MGFEAAIRTQCFEAALPAQRAAGRRVGLHERERDRFLAARTLRGAGHLAHVVAAVAHRRAGSALATERAFVERIAAGEPVHLHVRYEGDDDPEKCTARRLERFGLVDLHRTDRATPTTGRPTAGPTATTGTTETRKSRTPS